MKKKNPYWNRLIQVFKEAPPPYNITTGLSIPFLFGAYEVLEESFTSVDQIVKEIIDSEIDKFPIIHRCPEIGKHVIFVEEKFYCNKNYLKYQRIESEVVNNRLLISDTATQLGKTYVKICHNLNAEYYDCIKRSEYSWSKSNGRWRKFEDEEVKLIQSIK